MASKIYPLYKKAAASGGSNCDLLAGTVKVALVDTGTYTYSDSHEFRSSLSGVIGTPVALASKTLSNLAVFDAADSVLVAVSGTTGEALVLYVDTGNAATDRLVAYIDSATGLPITPNGADENIVWDAAGIFQL